MDTSRIAYPNVTTYMPPLAKRVIGIAADPSDPSDVYAAVEVGGLLASRDGGDSWDSITDGLYTDNHTVDLHGVKLSAAAPGNVFIIAQVAMFRSPDRGRRWQHLRFGEMFPGGSYCRGLAIAPDDPKTVYLAAEEYDVGALLTDRSRRRRRARRHRGGRSIVPKSRSWRHMGASGHRRHAAQPDVSGCHPVRITESSVLRLKRWTLFQQR